MGSNKIIAALEAEQMTKVIPDFREGDTVEVKVKVKEGDRERLQAFEGLVIARRNRGMNSAFTVRKISNGEGVERVFQSYSPNVAEIVVKRRGLVARAKLYYLRNLAGKAARIKKSWADWVARPAVVVRRQASTRGRRSVPERREPRLTARLWFGRARHSHPCRDRRRGFSRYCAQGSPGVSARPIPAA